MMDRDELINIIVEKVGEHWRSEGKPLHLAKIDPLLKNEGVEYKSIIAPQKLIQFVEGIGGISVVRHDAQKANIVLVPKGQDFTFESTGEAQVAIEEPSQKASSRGLRGKYVVLDFLDAVSRLEKSEAEAISIPVSVLAAIMRIK